MSEVWINDVDLADYGFVLGVDPAHGASPDYTDASAPLLGAIGPTWLGEPTQAGARKLVVGGYYVAVSNTQYKAWTDYLKALASTGAVRIRFSDRSDQEFRDARLMGFRPVPRAAILTNLAADLQMTFDVADPLRYDVNPQWLGLSTSRTSLPIGTAPTFPLVIIHGGGASLTNPSWIYRNSVGDSAQTMGFTGVLGANDYLIVDCRRVQVTKSVAGTQSDALSWWTAGDFLVVRSADGSYELAEYPTLELAASAGTPVGTIAYARTWQ